MLVAFFKAAVSRILRVSVPAVVLCSLISYTDVEAAAERADELIHTTLQLEPDLKRGQKLYRAQCSACHGQSAYGDANRLIPAIAGQRQAYLIKQFADFTELERITTEMHRVVARAEVNEPQEWMDVAAYINTLPVTVITQTGDGEMASFGEALYKQWCASCHEDDARGDDDGFVPSLRNQHYSYLAREIRGMGAGHRFNVDADLTRFLNSLKSDEVIGLADYLSRMRGPVMERLKIHDDGTVGD